MSGPSAADLAPRSSTGAKLAMVLVHVVAIAAGLALGVWVFEAVTT